MELDFDLYTLRIFTQVIAKKTFSEAARSLGITQPTVSQQIAKLEAQVGKLFQRVGHGLIPTELAWEFHKMTSEILEQADGFERKLQDARSVPKGIVRYGMPESCQWTPHYKRIMSQLGELTEIRLQIRILPNDGLIQELREGRLDFGFIVGEKLSPELRFQKFSEEAYSCIAANKKLFAPLQQGELENLRLITYPGWQPFFSAWAKHHGLSERISSQIPTPVVEVGTLAGAIHAIQQGAGLGIIPTHCVSSEIDAGNLLEFNPSKKARASNPVYLTRRLGEPLSKRVEATIALCLRT